MADTIKRAFRQSGLSMKRLSVQSDTRYASVWDFIKGDRDPALSTIDRWCKVLGLELRPVRGKRKAMVR